MTQVGTNEIARNAFIIYQGEPHQVIDKEYVNPGKGVAFSRFRLRALRSGNVVTVTIKAGELVELYDVFVKDMQLLYRDEDGFVFMDTESYEQVTIRDEVVGPSKDFLNDGESYAVLLHGLEGVGVRVPRRVVLTVVDAPPTVRGNTAANLTRVVTLSNRVTISAPAFIEVGDQIAVDPETRSYIERVRN